MWRSWLVLLLSVFFAPAAWSSEKVHLALLYEVPSESTSCPDVETMRRLVAAELGYDPFVDRSTDIIAIRFTIEARRAVARISRVQPGGPKQERRLIESDCGELSASVAFAVALQIDPTIALLKNGETQKPVEQPAAPLPGMGKDEPHKKPSAPSIVSLAPPEAPADVPVSPDVMLSFAIAAGLVIGGGVVPGVSVGPEIGAALEGDFWSVGLSVLGIVPGVQESDAGRVSASVVRGNLTPCLSTHFIPELSGAVCANLGLGALFGEATNVTRSTPTTALHAVLGPRAAISIEPWESFGFRLGALVDVALSRVHLEIDDRGKQREIWATPAVAALGDLAAVVRFR